MEEDVSGQLVESATEIYLTFPNMRFDNRVPDDVLYRHFKVYEAAANFLINRYENAMR